jgi:hypothetical protein
VYDGKDDLECPSTTNGNLTPRTLDTTASIDTNNGFNSSTFTIDSDTFWTKLPNMDQGHQNLLAEKLFCHIWHSEGKETAIELIQSYTEKNMMQEANSEFHMGCAFWADDENEKALRKLQRCRAIQEALNPQSTVLVYHQLDAITLSGRQSERNIRDDFPCHIEGPSRIKDEANIGDTESIVQVFYATGMIHMALRNFAIASEEFRLAIQIAAIGLGMEHQLTKASTYMLRKTLLTRGYSSPKITSFMKRFMEDIQDEIKVDTLNKSGKWEKALMGYANLNFLEYKDVRSQVRVRMKIATLWEENKFYDKALDMWASILVLYEKNPAFGLDHPFVRHAVKKLVDNQCQIQKMEI